MTCFLMLFNINHYNAQQLEINAILDTSKIRIGEKVKVDLYLNYNSNEKPFNVIWPEIGDTLTSQVEVISVSPIDTTIPDKNQPAQFIQHQQIIVSVYDSGYFAIPGFKFVFNNDSTHPKYTSPLFLEVHTVPTDSSATKLKDIKPPLLEVFNWKWYSEEIIWTGLILLLLVGAILLWYYRNKNKIEIKTEPEKPKVPAHITALQTLQKIKDEAVWKDGKTKEYYSEIADAIRLYIEERYELPALESTTDEIMLAFRSQVIDKMSKEKLQSLLQLCDLVKFAKMFPIEHEHNMSIQQAFDFVNGTKREEEIDASQFDESETEAS